jgi:LacI family transcriptional regulator
MRLKELAQHLGLSQTTVSRALNGYPEVKESTRQMVFEAAQRLGYRANASAQRLATGRVGAIGIVLRGSEEFGPHMNEFLGGLSGRLSDQEIDIVLTTVSSYEEELAAYRRAAASKKVDAFVLHSPHARDARVDLLLELGLPFVLHGRTDVGRPHAWLDIDNQGAIERAHLASARSRASAHRADQRGAWAHLR